MRVVVQRVKQASVTVDSTVVGAISEGLLLLVGIHKEDTLESVTWCVQKCLNLRIFHDEAGKMNHSALEASKEILAISQFTLFGDCSKGRRPNFTDAASAEKGKVLYELFLSLLSQTPLKIQAGIFQAEMAIDAELDGPVTIIVDRSPQE